MTHGLFTQSYDVPGASGAGPLSQPLRRLRLRGSSPAAEESADMESRACLLPELEASVPLAAVPAALWTADSVPVEAAPLAEGAA